MIAITEQAAAHIQKLMAKQGLSEGGLRVGIKGGGCSGLSYTFSWEKEARLGDEVFEGPGRDEGLRRQEEPALPERHDARVRLGPDGQGAALHQPQRQGLLRLRQLVPGVAGDGARDLREHPMPGCANGS